ncbi:MAG: hypothetical protein Q9164_005539 [Protoblastenia rupestris]
MPEGPKQKKRRDSSRRSSQNPRPNLKHRTTSSVQKTEIFISVYDLLPPGRLASALWFLGSSLLHTGVYIKALNREYAFGGHDRTGMSGVYWTRPGTEPPGGTFRCELLQGFTFQTEEEIEGIVRDVSQRFLGQSYNLLTNNCNHFTSFLCEKLTSSPAPSWLNRAASIGVALPCVVPREWIEPPDHDTADGELLLEDEDERTAMLRQEYRRASSERGNQVGTGHGGWESEDEDREGWKGKGKELPKDTDGRDIPASERAPPPGGR